MATQGDYVYSALNATETAETLVGTITVPLGATRIVGAAGQLMQPTATAGETVSGGFRLSPGQTGGKFKFPADGCFGPAGTLASIGPSWPQRFIPVVIPVKENDQVGCYMTANKALTGTGEGMVALLFE